MSCSQCPNGYRQKSGRKAIGRVSHYARQTYYSLMWHDSVCNTVQKSTVTSTIVAKKTTTWGESGVPSEFLGVLGLFSPRAVVALELAGWWLPRPLRPWLAILGTLLPCDTYVDGVAVIPVQVYLVPVVLAAVLDASVLGAPEVSGAAVVLEFAIRQLAVSDIVAVALFPPDVVAQDARVFTANRQGVCPDTGAFRSRLWGRGVDLPGAETAGVALAVDAPSRNRI